jgi:hypothetical protein
MPFAILTLLLLLAGKSQAQRGDWYNDEGGYVFEGEGTLESPYQITSITGLTYLAEQVNMTPGNTFSGVYFKLTEHLDLGAHFWISIGSDAAHPFQGTFDGNGKSIRNLYVNNSNSEGYPASGLFGYLGSGARILNLTIEGGTITGDASQSISYTGSLAGYVSCNVMGGEDSVVIRNCHNRHVKVVGGQTEHSNTGGLIGEGYAYCDGDGHAYILVENCSNNGEVTTTSSNFPYTGGILGKGRGHGYCDGTASSSGLLILSSCVNNGMVIGGGTFGDEAVSSTGGILGYGHATGDGYGSSDGSGAFTVYLCLNNGMVNGGAASSIDALSFAGGIFGYGDGYGYGDKLSISDTTNNGSGYGSGTFNVTSCANRGAITGGSTPGEGAIAAAGGIFGFASGSASGDEEGKGYGYGSFSMRNCYSAADVLCATGCAGGLGGWISTNGNGSNHSLTMIIQDCFAAGNINKSEAGSTAVTGGIAGRVRKTGDANTSPRIDRCVVALDYLGGAEGNTFRIAGQLVNIPAGSPTLSNNHAYAMNGSWGRINTTRNGTDWNGLMLDTPMDEWNATEQAWQFPRSNNVMPRLRGMPGQTNVPVPY